MVVARLPEVRVGREHGVDERHGRQRARGGIGEEPRVRLRGAVVHVLGAPQPDEREVAVVIGTADARGLQQGHRVILAAGAKEVEEARDAVGAPRRIR